MRHIFISYSRQDMELARGIAAKLNTWLVPVWWDQDLVAGDDFGQQILEQLASAVAVIVIWSDRSCVSSFVQNEARRALRMQKLIPVLAPGFAVERIPIEFGHLHARDALDHAGLRHDLETRGYTLTDPARVAEAPTIPDEVSVPLFDELLRRKSPDSLSRLQAARSVMRPVLEQIPITNYSHNSLSHAVQSTNLVSELFAEMIGDELTAEEVFTLGVFCFVHDIGMGARPNTSPELVYRAHNVYSHDFVLRLGMQGVLERTDTDAVAALCLMHNKDVQRAQVHFARIIGAARLGLLLSMFRVADILDVETQPGEMLRIKPEIVAQVIGDLEFDPTTREIAIWRGFHIGDREFAVWSDHFSAQLQIFNRELQRVGARLAWHSAGRA